MTPAVPVWSVGWRGTAPDVVETPGPQEVPTAEPSGPEVTPSPEPTDAPAPSATADPASPVPTPATVQPTVEATPSPTPEPSPSTTTPAPTPGPTATSTVQVPTWPSQPAVVESDVPWAVVATAAVVLALVAAGLWWWWRRGGATTSGPGAGTSPVGAVAPDDTPTRVLPLPGDAARASDAAVAADAADATVVLTPAPEGDAEADPLTARADATVRFLTRLGEAMIDAGAPIVQINATLQRVAAVNGLPDAAVVTLPTALMVSVPQHDTVQTAVSTAGTRSLRLDQVADVLDLASDASRGDVRPADGLVALAAIVSSEPASTPVRRAAGYVAIAAGLSLVLGGGWLDVLVASALGGAVALLQHLTRRVPDMYRGLLVAVCAFAVAVPVFLLVRTGWPVGLLAPLVAPLVTFLPGALLTTGVIDLATRQMIAGSSRLAAGVMQLVLLALGITAAAGLVGVPASDVGTEGVGQALGWLGPWVGVGVYAVGVVLNNDAHRGSLPWIALVLVVAYAGQVVGGVLLGAVVSSFVGALAMTPVAMLAATRREAPPFLVTFLPGFWVLVPGALGLVGVTSVLGRSTEHAFTTIVTTGVSMVAISLGVLAGLALGGVLQRRLVPDSPRIL